MLFDPSSTLCHDRQTSIRTWKARFNSEFPDSSVTCAGCRDMGPCRTYPTAVTLLFPRRLCGHPAFLSKHRPPHIPCQALRSTVGGGGRCINYISRSRASPRGLGKSPARQRERAWGMRAGDLRAVCLEREAEEDVGSGWHIPGP